ncbi:MAG: HD domain-containing protein [Bacteroidota bacterium]
MNKPDTNIELDKIEINEDIVRYIGKLADDLGYRVYIVGGYVRDYYLKRQREDFDFTVIGDSIAFAEKIAELNRTKAVVYTAFRTALVPLRGYKLEFVGTRKEEYLPDSRKPIVSEGTLEDDLKRRDFTINAMAVSLNKDTFGEVTDIFDGKSALEDKILKTPLEPEITFSDDPLRMLRAVRFASQLGFNIDESAFLAIRAMSGRISIVSRERIADEFFKIMKSAKPGSGFRILYETGLLEYVFPELAKLSGIETVQDIDRNYAHKDVLLHSLQVLDCISESTDNVWLRIAALVHDIAKPQTKRFIKGSGWSYHGHEEFGARKLKHIFNQMKFSKEHLPYIEKLVRMHHRPMALVDEGVTDSAVRRLASQAGDALEDLFMLCRADITTKNPNLSAKYLNNYDIVTQKVIEVQEKDKLREFQSPVRGDEIMQICKLPPSQTVGYIKTTIEEAILDGIIPNEYDAAKQYFMENKDTWLLEFKGSKKAKKQ